MKKETFIKMINNPPQGATHYRKFKSHVVFYRNIDNSFGSYDTIDWYADEDYPYEQWHTRRSFPNVSKLTQL